MAMITSKLNAIFLNGTTGDQNPLTAQALSVAQALASFIDSANRSLRIAIYDFRLTDQNSQLVLDALKRAATDRNVKISIAFDAGKTPDNQDTFNSQGADPAPSGNQEFLSALDGVANIDQEAIDGKGHLMHSKYVVRDAGTSDAAIWTGSTNFTDDAWGRQENNIVIVQSPMISGFYQNDFLELFAQRNILSTGKDDTGESTLGDAKDNNSDESDVIVQFSPGQGKQIDSAIAEAIRSAQTRVRIASMVITSGTILGAIADAREAGVDVQGVYDATQMKSALNSITQAGDHQGKVALFQRATDGFSSKDSAPFHPNSVHDFMHNKVAVIDDTVFTGSFNFSANAAKNAENSLQIRSSRVAAEFANYVDTVIKRYQ
jgi:phosphatidylserine/phosphatidylglycerophosphate/cardiolipin synthase-like enzyme